MISEIFSEAKANTGTGSFQLGEVGCCSRCNGFAASDVCSVNASLERSVSDAGIGFCVLDREHTGTGSTYFVCGSHVPLIWHVPDALGACEEVCVSRLNLKCVV